MRAIIAIAVILSSVPVRADTCVLRRDAVMRMYETLSAYIEKMQVVQTEKIVRDVVVVGNGVTDATKKEADAKVNKAEKERDRALKRIIDEMTYVSELCLYQGTSKEGTEEIPPP